MNKIDNNSNDSINLYKLRIVFVQKDNYGFEEYGFDDIDLQLVNLKTYKVIGIFTGSNQDQYYFTREDFDFF